MRVLASAASMHAWLLESIGTSGSRVGPTRMPILFSAYFSGIGLLVANSASTSGISR